MTHMCWTTQPSHDGCVAYEYEWKCCGTVLIPGRHCIINGTNAVGASRYVALLCIGHEQDLRCYGADGRKTSRKVGGANVQTYLSTADIGPPSGQSSGGGRTGIELDETIVTMWQAAIWHVASVVSKGVRMSTKENRGYTQVPALSPRIATATLRAAHCTHTPHTHYICIACVDKTCALRHREDCA